MSRTCPSVSAEGRANISEEHSNDTMHWIAPEMSHDTWTYECEPQLRLRDQLSLFNQYRGGGGKLDMGMSVNEGTPLLMSFFSKHLLPRIQHGKHSVNRIVPE